MHSDKIKIRIQDINSRYMFRRQESIFRESQITKGYKNQHIELGMKLSSIKY